MHSRFLEIAVASFVVLGASLLAPQPRAVVQAQPDVIRVEAAAKPDIAVSGLALVVENAESGTTLRVKFTPKVSGKLGTDCLCDVHLTNQLSNLSVDTRIARVAVRTPRSMGAVPVYADIPVSAQTLTRMSYLVVVMDPDNEVAEANERNNQIAKFLRTAGRPLIPDQKQSPSWGSSIAVDGLTLSRTEASADQRIGVTFNIKNLTQNSLEAVPYSVYLEHDYTLHAASGDCTSTGRIELGEGVTGKLAPGSTYTVSLEVIMPWEFIPTADGNKIYAEVDPDWQMDEDVSDNRMFQKVSVTVPKRPDLAVRLLGAKVIQSGTRTDARLAFRVTNVGERTAPESSVLIKHRRQARDGAWSDWRRYVLDTGKLDPGRFLWWTLEYSSPKGVHRARTFEIYADSRFEVAEASEDNNALNISLSLTPAGSKP